MAKITSKDKQNMIRFGLALIASALLWTPIDNVVTNIFGSGDFRFIAGIGFVIAIAMVGRFNI